MSMNLENITIFQGQYLNLDWRVINENIEILGAESAICGPKRHKS